MPEISHILLLPRLRIQAANAVSGPLTWGFPSPTAFTGFAHALERKLTSELPDGFSGVGIICHRFEPQIFKSAGSYTSVFSLSRNPVGKDGSSAALVEEGKAHLEVSLLIGIQDYLDEEDAANILNRIQELVFSMRLAGGSILPALTGEKYQPKIIDWPEGRDNQQRIFRKLRYQLLPGFALTLREDKLQSALADLQKKNPQATALDALLDISRLNFEPADNPDNDGHYEWNIRSHQGWLVPLPVGYAAISDLYPGGTVNNSRDPETPFRFVESIYSIGEWVSPHRIEQPEQLFWYTEADTEAGIYRCTNHYTNSKTALTANVAELIA